LSNEVSKCKPLKNGNNGYSAPQDVRVDMATNRPPSPGGSSPNNPKLGLPRLSHAVDEVGRCRLTPSKPS